MDTIAQTLGQAPAPSPEPAPGPTPAPGPAPAPAAWTPKDYPKTWKPDYADKWKTMPQDYAWVHEEAHRREDDFHKGIEQYKGHAAVGQRYSKVLEQYMPTFQEHGIADDQVDQMMAGLLSAQFTLVRGTPEQKLDMFKQLCSDYQIEPLKLAQALGLSAQSFTSAPPPPDPHLTALQQEVQSLKSNLSTREQQEAAQRRAQVQREIKAFADANPDFTLVGNEVAQLLTANPKMDLKSAYEQALWLSPATREKQIQAKIEADRKAAERAQADHAAQAAAATAGSTRTPARSPSATAPTGTMDDTMRATLAEIKGRT